MVDHARPISSVIAFPGTDDDLVVIAEAFSGSAEMLEAVATPSSGAVAFVAAMQRESRRIDAA